MVIRYDSRSVGFAAEVLGEGGVAIIPCDTIYGLCGKAPDTGERIVAIKSRDTSKKLITLAANIAEVNYLLSEPIPSELAEHWPGPLTIISRGVSGETMAVRIPDDAFLLDLMRAVGPIYSTSVNISGEPHLTSISDIVESYGTLVDLIIDNGDMNEGIPSTIIDATTKPYRLIRDGAFSIPADMDITRT